MTQDAVDLTVRFTDPDTTDGVDSQYLSYYVARYNIEGEFLGFRQLKTQLSICNIGYRQIINMKRFGIVTEKKCDYELINLVGGKDDIPKDANAFYEIFIRDAQGNLIDVPVVVTNLIDIDQETPNEPFNM